MKRKTFIHRVSLGSGALLLPYGLLQSCDFTPKKRVDVSEADIPLLDAIGETIIPETAGSPGAKSADIGSYMLMMAQDCLVPRKRKIFKDGLDTLDDMCAKKFNNGFIALQKEEKIGLVKLLQREAISAALEQSKKGEIVPHYFELIKELTIKGYFSSRIGMTIAREYEPLPGRYIACMEISGIKRPWAS